MSNWLTWGSLLLLVVLGWYFGFERPKIREQTCSDQALSSSALEYMAVDTPNVKVRNILQNDYQRKYIEGCLKNPSGEYVIVGRATAICYDLWVSYSSSRSGTCSHHGGVVYWVN